MPQTRVKNFTVTYEQETEFRDLKREIFGAGVYFFDFSSAAPVIIDGGAHLGLATLYWKWLYPQAKIFAFEPNPALTRLYRRNVADNQLSDVTLIEAALGRKTGPRPFYLDKTSWQWYSTGSLYPGAWDGSQKDQTAIKVEVLSLAKYLQSWPRVDLLKLDLEGAESGVLLSLGQLLGNVRGLICEFHSGHGQRLPELLQFLRKYGLNPRLKDRHNRPQSAWHEGELVMIEALR